MIRLNIIVEGQTEEAFVNKVMVPHLAQSEVFAIPRLIKTGEKKGHIYRGGMTTYGKAKEDIKRWISQDKGKAVRFTTMFDLYRLPKDFPKFNESEKIAEPYQRVNFLENSLKADIREHRFTPYIQLYEYEALILSDPTKFEFVEDSSQIEKLMRLVKKFKSPELINDGAETAPSKRIIKIIPEYKYLKPIVGPSVAQQIGLETIRKKCPHFNEWLIKLETLS